MQIKKLKIYTTKLAAQSQFYADVLSLEKVDSAQKTVSFKVGKSLLEFESAPNATPYHFAINIPSNQELEALKWLKSRVEILKDGSNEIHDFVAWNAKAMYFYDPDQNIVEFIARKNLANSSEAAFDQNALIEISEIGLPTEDIEKEFNLLNKNLGLEIYSGNFDRFCAIGDENGLFICVDKNIKDWFPTNNKAYPSNFEVIVGQHGKAYTIDYKNEKLKTSVSID